MGSSVILKAKGLHTSANELSRPEGSLLEAKNIIIRRDDIIEQRRGFKLYGNELPDTTERVKQLTTYRSRILRHYADRLQYDSDGAGAFLSLIGSFSETEAGLRMKFLESNGNLYFTTSEGIKKISARNADDFSSTTSIVKTAGAVKAIDLEGEAVYEANLQTGFLPQDSVVAYRVLWSYKDLNNNLVQGVPSQREIVYNPMVELLIRDFTRVLSALDGFSNTPLTSARINDKNYIQTLGLDLSSTAADLRTNLIALTAKIDADILVADQALVAPLTISGATISSGVCTINFSAGNPNDYFINGSKIFLAGFAPATGTLNGAQEVTSLTASSLSFNTTATGAVVLSSATVNSNEYRSITQPTDLSVPVVNADLVELQNYLDAIILRLGEEPTAIISTTDQATVDTLDITTTANVKLEITIPSGIDSDYFYQIYRSPFSQATGAVSIDDMSPNDELQQVYEAYPTTQELEAGVITVVDVTPEDFKGANLYTNPSTGEGILSANEAPPFAKDMARYRNSIFYANTRTKQNMLLNMVGVESILSDYDATLNPKIVFSNGTVTNVYNFIRGVQEVVDITTVADVANSLNGKYFYLYSPRNSYYVYFETTTATDPAIAGFTAIKVSLSTGDTANVVAQKLANKLKTYLDDFIVEVATNTVTVTMLEYGYLKDAVDEDTGFTISVTQSGQGERSQAQITKVTFVAASQYVSSGTADYFTLNNTGDANRYYFYFKVGTATDPAISGRTGIPVELDGTETAAQVAGIVADLIESTQFNIEISSNVLTIENIQYGTTTNATESVVDAGFLISTEQIGALDVLLSPQVSPARAVDETSKSLIRVMNKNPGELVYGFYLSSNYDIPGKMQLQAKDITTVDRFYVLTSSNNVGDSFNPTIGPEFTISSIGTGANPVITTTSPHGLTNGEQVVICNSNSTPNIDGLYTITYINTTQFSVDRYVSVAGTSGVLSKANNTLYSENDDKPNRVYYSKTYQPEAVPLLQYFDVGGENKAILRIVALRDSLFVFKEDGLYRISGLEIPFQLELFDSSFITLAPDSVAVCNNIVYAWTTQGIQSLSEGGSYTISRPIDNIILKTQSSNFVGFKTATFALGYESDNSYIVYTVSDMEDEVATIAYRFNTLTNTWTTFDQSKTCGVVNSFDDKVYLGCTDLAFIEQERKSFDRIDYADREFDDVIGLGAMLNKNIILPSVTNYAIGDVIVQTQTITTYEFNALLEKLDADPGPADNNYLSLLQLERGDSARTKLNQLAVKLDADANVATTIYESSIEAKSGSITNNTAASATVITSASHELLTGRKVRIVGSNCVPSIDGEHVVTVINANTFSIPVRVTSPGTAGTFETLDNDFVDLKACYNKVIELLNNDTGIIFNNYKVLNNDTIQEVIITAINRVTKTVTVNLELDLLAGDIVIYKAINSSFTYNPVHMGDPLFLKHLRESTVMFETRTLTGGTLSFATDLMPEFLDVPFTLAGNGIFGHNSFGEGLFGGLGNSAPFRTYIPRNCQRCRYVAVKFSHSYAREFYRINGITITGNIQQSTRAYR